MAAKRSLRVLPLAVAGQQCQQRTNWTEHRVVVPLEICAGVLWLCRSLSLRAGPREHRALGPRTRASS